VSGTGHPPPEALLELHFDEARDHERDSLARHARECRACGALLSELRSVEAALARGPFEAPPRDGLERVLARVDVVRRTRAHRAEWALAAVPSAAALMAGAWATQAGGERLSSLGLVPASGLVSPWLLGASLAALGLVVLGALVTLALAPILILDSNGRS
jgi:hypothetical protein